MDDLVIEPGGVLGERPITLDGIGQTIEITAEGQLLPADTPVTGSAIPYFQWDNRDGRPMRVWMKSLLAGGTTPPYPPDYGGLPAPHTPWPIPPGGLTP